MSLRQSGGRAAARMPRRLSWLGAGSLVLGVGLVGTAGSARAAAPPPLVQQVSSDTLTATPTVPSGIHHATEVETDTAAWGSTVVSSFQVGRFSAYGAMAMGFATSTDGGQTWQQGLLPGLTANSPSPDAAYVSVANQSVFYDAAAGRWLVPTVAVAACSSLLPRPPACGPTSTATEQALLVSTSSDGVTWNDPVTAVASDVDKPWGTCDNSPASPYYGTCYVAYAQIDDGDRLALVRSTDGGATWSAPVTTTSGQDAYNAIPVVQPDGNLVVVATDVFGNGGNGSQLLSFISTDGGVTLGDAATGPGALPVIEYHLPAGGIRAKNKPTVAVDAAGTLYVAWSDCRFRPSCSANDIVYSTSADGVNWSAPQRIPSFAASGPTDQFIPGLAVRPGTSGSSAEIGVVSYEYPQAACTTSSCRLNVEFASSVNGGATWTTTKLNTTAMQLGWLAPSSLGPMVGDYEAVAYSAGHAVTVFPVAAAPTAGVKNESEYAATMAPQAAGAETATAGGSGQVVAAGAPYPSPLSVTVTDPATGQAVVGATVTFALPAGGAAATFPGGATTATAVTDVDGDAASPTVTAGSGGGSFTATATASGATGTAAFTLATSGPAAAMSVPPGVSPQGVPAGQSLGEPLAVTVDDASGRPVAGTPVTFSAPTSGPSGTFAAPGTGNTATVVTDDAGRAVAPTYTANTTTGSYVVTAIAGGASASLSVTNTSGPPAHIAVVGGAKQSATVGTTFGQPIQISVTDAAHAPWPGAAVTLTAPAKFTSLTFPGTGAPTITVDTNAAGIATVPAPYAGTGVGTFTVHAVAGTVTTSFTMTVTVGAPAKIVVSGGTPQSTAAGSPFPTALTATVKDPYGNPVPGVGVTWSAPAAGASATFPGGGTTTSTVTASNGVATAFPVTADATTGSYTVTASVPGLATAADFVLTND